MVEVRKIMVTSFKRPHAGTATLSAPSLQQAMSDPRLHQTLLDTHGQVWSVSCGVATTGPLGPGAHKLLFVPSKSLFPQSFF